MDRKNYIISGDAIFLVMIILFVSLLVCFGYVFSTKSDIQTLELRIGILEDPVIEAEKLMVKEKHDRIMKGDR